MRFEDLKLIQQLMVLSNMINKPDTSERLDGNVYCVPDTDYVIDVFKVYTATDVYIPTTSATEKDSFNVNFTDIRSFPGENDTVNLEFITAQNDDKHAPIDKFGLLADMLIRGDLSTALKKIISVTETLFKMGFVKNNPSAVLKRLLSLIPIAESLPAELFERVYIDPIGANVVMVIHESVDAAFRKSETDYLKDGIIVEDYYYGHVVRYEGRDPDHSGQKLGLTIGYGLMGLNNVISFRVSDYNSDFFKPEYLFSLKVTSLQSTESVLAGLKKEVYDAINKNENKTLLTPLADIYFNLMDEARTDIIGRLMPF